MNNTKLINVLRTFSKNEMKEFEKLVSSSFFSGWRNYMPFFNIIKKFHPKFDDDKLTPEYVYKKLYPGKKYNKQMIWNLNTSMLNMAEEYILQVSLRKNKFIKKNLIAGEYKRRKLGTYYSKMLDEMEGILDRMGIDNDYFRFKTELESGRMDYHFLEDSQHLLSGNILKKGEYVIVNAIKDISDFLNDSSANLNMFNARYDYNIPAEFAKNLKLGNIIEYARKNNYKYAWIMEMYYSAIMALQEMDNTKYFFRLKELFEENYEKFTHRERELWTTSLVNYCIYKSGEEELQFRKILFELNNFQLKEFASSDEKYLAKIQFIQTLRTALSVNETEWVKRFIDEYVPKLKNSYQKPMRALANAFLGLKLKDFNMVLDNLGKVKFIDIRDKLYVKSLYIRTYFELGETETLLYHIDSTKHFVNKNSSVSEQTRRNYNLFLNTLGRLITAKEAGDEFEIDKLKKEIEGDKNQVFSQWLTEKIEEIKSK